MADEEEAKEEAKEVDQAEGGEAAAGDGSKIMGMEKKKFFIIAGAGAGVLILLIILLVIMLGGDEPVPDSAPATTADAGESAGEGAGEDTDGGAGDELDEIDALDKVSSTSKEDAMEAAKIQQDALNKNTGTGASVIKGPALFYSIRPMFVVNFQSTRKAKFLQVGVDVMTRNSAVIDDVIDNLPIIKNDLIHLFSSQKYDELRTPEGKDKMRKDALAAVQAVLLRETGRAGIEDVLFTQLVMQ